MLTRKITDPGHLDRYTRAITNHLQEKINQL